MGTMNQADQAPSGDLKTPLIDAELARRERAALRDEALRLQGVAEVALARSRHLEQQLDRFSQQAVEVDDLDVRVCALEQELERLQGEVVEIKVQKREAAERESCLRDHDATLANRIAEAEARTSRAETRCAPAERERDTVLAFTGWRLTTLPRKWFSALRRS